MSEWWDLSQYDFELPEGLIAQHPVTPRDASRLMVVDRASRQISHRKFTDLVEYVSAGDLIVANNSRVIPARLKGFRAETGGAIEFVLLEEESPGVWAGICRSTARQRPGLVLDFAGEVSAELLTAPDEAGVVRACFTGDPLQPGVGELPLPPYIERAGGVEAPDLERYQTTYAKVSGSAAAPTAGLHFTPELRASLASQGVGWGEVTLHVGLGTFRPIKTQDVREHQMHEERFEVSGDLARAFGETRGARHAVFGVGTTTVRTLESAASDDRGGILPGVGRTRIFLHPGAPRPARVDHLITNFHLPKSSLLLLVSAFSSWELMRHAYAEAVKEEYRFFSYGDAMLIF